MEPSIKPVSVKSGRLFRRSNMLLRRLQHHKRIDRNAAVAGDKDWIEIDRLDEIAVSQNQCLQRYKDIDKLARKRSAVVKPRQQPSDQ
jgi:hypothetical protein